MRTSNVQHGCANVWLNTLRGGGGKRTGKHQTKQLDDRRTLSEALLPRQQTLTQAMLRSPHAHDEGVLLPESRRLMIPLLKKSLLRHRPLQRLLSHRLSL